MAKAFPLVPAWIVAATDRGSGMPAPARQVAAQSLRIQNKRAGSAERLRQPVTATLVARTASPVRSTGVAEPRSTWTSPWATRTISTPLWTMGGERRARPGGGPLPRRPARCSPRGRPRRLPRPCCPRLSARPGARRGQVPRCRTYPMPIRPFFSSANRIYRFWTADA